MELKFRAIHLHSQATTQNIYGEIYGGQAYMLIMIGSPKDIASAVSEFFLSRKQVVYSISGLSNGSHTIKIINKTTSYGMVDSFKVYKGSQMLNNNAGGITY